MALADTDNEARVSVGGAACSRDEVVGLENEVAVVGVAVAIGQAVWAVMREAENAPAVALDDVLPEQAWIFSFTLATSDVPACRKRDKIRSKMEGPARM